MRDNAGVDAPVDLKAAAPSICHRLGLQPTGMPRGVLAMAELIWHELLTFSSRLAASAAMDWEAGRGPQEGAERFARLVWLPQGRP